MILIGKLSVNIWLMMLMIGEILIQCVNSTMKKKLRKMKKKYKRKKKSLNQLTVV